MHGQTFSQISQPTRTISGAPGATPAVVTHVFGQNSVLSINGSLIAALVEPSQFLVSGATLLPGGPAVIISGTPMSLDPGGSTLVPGSSTILLPAQAVMLTLRSSTLTANSAGQFAIGGRTLTPGAAAITISGTSISLAISDAYAVLDGSTVSLNHAPLTVGGQVLTLHAGAGNTVEGKTLSPGGSTMEANGTVFSLVSTTCSSGALASLITSGFGAAPMKSGQTSTGIGGISAPRDLWTVLLVAVGIILVN